MKNEYKNQVCERLGLSGDGLSVAQDALVRAIVMLENKKQSLSENKRDTTEKEEKLTKALAALHADQEKRVERFERMLAEYETAVKTTEEKIRELKAPPTEMIDKIQAEIKKIEETIGSL